MKLLSTLFLAGITSAAFAQNTQVMGTANATLDIANVRATIQNGGDFFTKDPGVYTSGGLQQPGFEVPKGSGKHTIFSGGLWLGGKDASGQIYTVSQTYRQGSPTTYYTSYWPGPIGTVQGSGHNSKYDKIWKVSKAQIQFHIANYGSPTYSMPADIATWPGNGNTANGEAIQLAPFVDLNNDGIYSPNLGDHPKIKGDQALYSIINDKGNTKYPNSPTMNAEIHVMYYAFNTPQNTAVHNTVFSEYRIINRGQINYNNFYAGLFVDFDLGFYNDDFVGSDVTNNRFFAYNGDNDDEGPAGYGANPPVQSVIFLDHDMSQFLYYNNNSNSTNGNPQTSQNFYNYLTGIWKDGKYMTYGLDGTDQLQAPYKFMYSADTDPYGYGFNNPGQVPPFNWTEENTNGTAKSNTPGDRRGVGSIGPFNLNSGQELKFTVAYSFSQGISAQHSTGLATQDAIAVQNFFNSAIVNSNRKEQLKQPLQLFPNPATDQLTVQLPTAFENKKATISITDNLGRKVLETPVSSQTGKQLQLNIASLSKGIYQVKVTSGEETFTAKLAKL